MVKTTVVSSFITVFVRIIDASFFFLLTAGRDSLDDSNAFARFHSW